MVAGALPIKLEAEIRAVLRRARKEDFEWQGLRINATTQRRGKQLGKLKHAVKKIQEERWGEEWISATKGLSTKQYFPTVENRLKNKWYKPNHFTSQFITGHGNFAASLFKRKIMDSNMCECGEIEDDIHVAFQCPNWNNERKPILDRMTSKAVGWPPKAEVLMEKEFLVLFEEFAHNVMRQKEAGVV